MNYKFTSDSWSRVFAVPSCVVEQYIKLASGSALKVLLFILYNNDRDYSAEEISAALNIPLEAAGDAFCFWEQVGVLCRNGQDSKPVPVSPQRTAQPPAQASVPEAPKPRSKSSYSLTPREIAERIGASEEIAFLFSAAETALQHLLNHTEQRSLIWMHDYLGLPADVILMLLEYCRIIGKLSMAYIEKVAIAWQEKEILTHEAAEKEIQSLKERHSLTYKILSAFGINRKLIAKEEEYIAEWTAKNYDIDLISYAYEKTIESINKLSFPYINKILNGWYAKGLLTREQVDKDTQAFSKNLGGAEKAHSYDLDKFERLALNYTPKIMKEGNGET